MHERNSDAAFWSIIENKAANDIHLRGLSEYLMLGKTELVSADFLENFDMLDMQAYLRDYYGLDEDAVERVIERHERAVLETLADDLGVADEQT
ncbi:hypothetical protein HY379_02535 [Candidatus Saccharibacteria bacterium]|nr:hypothetical protein [Candidatus Saccharibacteria bacterium]